MGQGWTVQGGWVDWECWAIPIIIGHGEVAIDLLVKGCKDKPRNNGPVNLASVVGKLLERIWRYKCTWIVSMALYVGNRVLRICTLMTSWLILNASSNEAKHIIHFLYHPIYLCCHLQWAMNLVSKTPLHINAVKSLPLTIYSPHIQLPKVQCLTFVQIKLHQPFLQLIYTPLLPTDSLLVLTATPPFGIVSKLLVDPSTFPNKVHQWSWWECRRHD